MAIQERGATVGAAVWWPYEVHRCGRQALALPVVAALLAYAAGSADSATGLLLGRSVLSCALPAAAALACAAVVARERMPELHLSLPTRYARTVARRLCWPAAVTASAAIVLVAALAATGRRALDDPLVLLWELTGLTSLLSGGAVWATARSGSAAPAAGLVTALVLAKLLLLDRVVSGAAQALPALLAGILLTVRALRALDPGRAGEPPRTPTTEGPRT
ncbi:hypothetical protein [Streptomyces candidus]|uniref:Uncharacterized protein n=1 Tax=Streptomyces candidus TaxID=67283 RepID=A0A7X0HCN0_9ACTN|nr:hypothetical protein [Streptomyces candidus]MBB6435125.1 hypothetical protein [Streptomyces candidus]GHH40765.1 hypothetical protein GCM10018773_22430 [Streptomyces candidus]